MMLNENRLFPADGAARAVAVKLYDSIRDMPIVSPHGHCDPRWFAENGAFPNPTALFIQPDHYIFRMLYSQGVSMESLGIPQADGKQSADPREVWRIFAKHYYLFRGTPTRLWIDYAFEKQFGLKKRLGPDNADEYYDVIAKRLETPEFRPRALFESFNIEVLTTTDTPLDTLDYHKAMRASGWKGRVLPTFRFRLLSPVASDGCRTALALERGFGRTPPVDDVSRGRISDCHLCLYARLASCRRCSV